MDNTPVAEHSTVPYSAQVVAFDPTVTDAIPMWADDSLNRGVATGSSGIAIATRSDFDNDTDDLVIVRMRVWIGDAHAPSGRVIYQGALRIGDEGIMIGSVIGNDLHHVAVPAGEYGVKVQVEPKEPVDLIDVVLKQVSP